ncbi:MAG TPA: hypothetical protein VGG45_01865 [Terracidiphilus sp.]|jgi:hypothetical protein
MKPERYFYAIAGAVFLVLTVIGFQHYIFHGKHSDGSAIAPAMLAIVVAHSSAIFAWFVMLFVQAVLITSHNRRVHMTLGWGVVGIAALIVVTGPLVAFHSMRLDPSQIIFDWPGTQFLLIMYTEIALFAVFVTIGVLNRKRPRIHRPMMLMACLAIVSGATARIALVNSIFGFHHWVAIFGPVVVLGVLLLLLRAAMTRRFEREFALGLAVMVAVTMIAGRLATTGTWVDWAGTILKR